MPAEWDFPTIGHEYQLYEQGRGDLVHRVERGIIELATDSVSLVAYEVRSAAKTIVCHAIIGVDGNKPDEQAVLAYLRAECEVWGCPLLVKQ